ncbi:MAG: hypothetical protein L3J05_02120 [Robiginitomaculum sp.]|nr:hypothetical protein [Robiginitomaculum sp.]
MQIKVKKRDAESVDYDEVKIYTAIEKAVKSVAKHGEGEMEPHMRTIIVGITSSLDNIIKGYVHRGDEQIDVEMIQDLVEQQLMGAGLYDVARAYILYREEHKKARNQRLRPDASAIQDYMLASRYARYLPEEGRRETFAEAVGRVRDMHLRRYPRAEEDIRWAFDQVIDKRCLPSMRSMQFAGPAIAGYCANEITDQFTKFGFARQRQQSCGFVNVRQYGASRHLYKVSAFGKQTFQNF